MLLKFTLSFAILLKNNWNINSLKKINGVRVKNLGIKTDNTLTLSKQINTSAKLNKANTMIYAIGEH